MRQRGWGNCEVVLREDGGFYFFFDSGLGRIFILYSGRAFGRFTSRATAEWIQWHLFTARRMLLRI